MSDKRKSKGKKPHCPGAKKGRIGRRCTLRRNNADSLRTRLTQHAARRQVRRLLYSAADELVRVAVKASVVGIGVLALYGWHHWQ
ncbi:hypothetical protein [Streptomyces sp. WM6378]|uniref:hypothetical protein n=1 Tax=Streptomyces sp. WM6378 TaxID=1415557 RepID=UPI000B23649A|nr:hypothetical protein [Streptomyces sp. WM6378]